MGIESYLPSKKFQKRAGLILGIFIIVVIGFTLIDRDQVDKKNTSQLAFSKTDTDKDGLRDWEEGIWGTDAYNPDTDGDGVTDGEEVKNNRDPLKTGSDQITNSRLAAVYSSYKRRSLENINITDQIADKILPHSLLLANELEQNQTISNTSRTDLLIEPIVSQYRLEQNNLSVEDLNLVSVTEQSLLDYFSTVLETSNSVLANTGGNEISLALSESNVQIEKQLNNYRRVVDGFARAQVPTPLAEPHVAVLNNFIRMQGAFELLISAEDDDMAKKIYVLDELKTLQAQNLASIQQLALAWRSAADTI